MGQKIFPGHREPNPAMRSASGVFVLRYPRNEQDTDGTLRSAEWLQPSAGAF